jgi:hypothetical protein
MMFFYCKAQEKMTFGFSHIIQIRMSGLYSLRSVLHKVYYFCVVAGNAQSRSIRTYIYGNSEKIMILERQGTGGICSSGAI